MNGTAQSPTYPLTPRPLRPLRLGDLLEAQSGAERERSFRPSATVWADHRRSWKSNGRTEEEATHQWSSILLLCPVFELGKTTNCVVMKDKTKYENITVTHQQQLLQIHQSERPNRHFDFYTFC